jgi:hypothetical protein
MKPLSPSPFLAPSSGPPRPPPLPRRCRSTYGVPTPVAPSGRALRPIAGAPSSSPPRGESIGESLLARNSAARRRRLRRIRPHRPARQPEMIQDAPHDRGIGDRRRHPRPASAPRTRQDVDTERPSQQIRPGPRGLPARGGTPLRARRPLVPLRWHPCHDASTPPRVGRQHAMTAGRRRKGSGSVSASWSGCSRTTRACDGRVARAQDVQARAEDGDAAPSSGSTTCGTRTRACCSPRVPRSRT